MFVIIDNKILKRNNTIQIQQAKQIKMANKSPKWLAQSSFKIWQNSPKDCMYLQYFQQDTLEEFEIITFISEIRVDI